MLLYELLRIANFKISGGSEFLWKCYGLNARILDFSESSGQSIDHCSGVSCVFDSETQQVYEVNIYEANLYTENNKWYRWIDADFIEDYKKECSEREVPFELAIDDKKWTDLEYIEDVLRKVPQVIETGSCDDDVTIKLDLNNDELLTLCMYAHEKNITLNDLIKEILEAATIKAKKIIEDNI